MHSSLIKIVRLWEVSADKTKYMVMSRDQNAGRIHSVRTDNSTFQRVEEFKIVPKYLNSSTLWKVLLSVLTL